MGQGTGAAIKTCELTRRFRTQRTQRTQGTHRTQRTARHSSLSLGRLCRGLLHGASDISTALDRVSFQVPYGAVFGLLGPNGAGKTTLMKILCTLLLPTSGDGEVIGHSLLEEHSEIREKVNYVPSGERSLYWRLSPRENLRLFAALYGITGREAEGRIEELLVLMDLEERGDDRVERLSTGMKQRLSIARGLINSPEILFLDEPTSGLDPGAARQTRAYLRQLTDKRATVVMATHNMAEADEICDLVLIMSRGRIVAQGEPCSLKADLKGIEVLEFEARSLTVSAQRMIQALDTVEAARFEPIDEGTVTRITVHTDDFNQSFEEITAAVVSTGASLRSFHRKEPTLEDVFLRHTKDDG